jgi:hypothetical protein
MVIDSVVAIVAHFQPGSTVDSPARTAGSKKARMKIARPRILRAGTIHLWVSRVLRKVMHISGCAHHSRNHSNQSLNRK